MDLDAAFAFTIDYHVIEAYKFLIKQFCPGDKIYLFGFSRGSFVARILAGMIHKIGLLDQSLQTMVPTAWKMYQKWEKDGQPTEGDSCESLEEFQKTFCRQKVEIELMGLFDSVNSCGIIIDRMFPYTSITSHVKHIRHAISINERRCRFKENLFAQNPEQELGAMSDPELQPLFSVMQDQRCSDDMVEVWFPGDHSDIGGSWPLDENGHQLSNVSLRWMLSFALEFGVLFKQGAINEFSTKFPPKDCVLACHHDNLSLKRPPYMFNDCQPMGRDDLFPVPSKTPIELSETGEKGNCGRGDSSLIATWFWWFVEILPFGYLTRQNDGKWVTRYWPNFGNHRIIPKGAKIHWSLLWRSMFISDYRYSNVPLIYQDFVNSEKMEHGHKRTKIAILSLVDCRTGALDETKISSLLEERRKHQMAVDWNALPDDLNRCIRYSVGKE